MEETPDVPDEVLNFYVAFCEHFGDKIGPFNTVFRENPEISIR